MVIRGISTAASLAAGWLFASLIACDWDFERMNDQPRCEPGDRRPWLPDQRCDHRAPEGTVAWRARRDAGPRPLPTRASIARGADRFARFCAACHGALGDADSVIARDMSLRRPASLHEADIVAATDQRLFEVITAGYGLMPSYAYVLQPHDRWAVVDYVRVLQLSQSVALDALPQERRAEARRWMP